ncbi:MAG: L,D-transpeptidase family protein [Planctomycetia bacterium]|nr:L,D-transpeptidase family protein [Planctomycetia bacterium]
MQFFKTILIVAILSGVAYGVYMALTGTRDVAPPPGAAEDDWKQGAPQIELPSVETPPTAVTPGVAPSAGGPPAAPHVVQPQPVAPAEAPRYGTEAAHQDAGAAPPFVAPGVGPSTDSAPPVAGPPTTRVDAMQEERYVNRGAVAPDQPPLAGPAVSVPQSPAAASVPPAATIPPPSAGPDAGATFQGDYAAAQGLLHEHRLDDALVLLSRWYDDPRLAEQDQQPLLDLLNQLAGTVIYSREHLLVPGYEVQAGDTLDRIAQHYRVPWQLLAKINGIQDPNRLRAGEKLKVVQGPFDATVNLRNRYLTLFLGNRFAGRFPVGVGADQTTPEGEYPVKEKTTNPTYYGERAIEASDPANPFGKYWIGLGNQLGIHGTNDPQSIGQAESRGCIRLHPRDIEDVYDMMTVESRVKILR